jgi:hypothetical protein
MGFPWDDPKNSVLTDHHIITGDIPAAVESYLFRVNQPMASNPQRHKRREKVFYAPVYEDPAVVARLSQLDKEYEVLREEVSELMQEPEWNQ